MINEQTMNELNAYERQYVREYRAAREDRHYAHLNLHDDFGAGRPGTFHLAELEAAKAKIESLEAVMPETVKRLFGITD